MSTHAETADTAWLGASGWLSARTCPSRDEEAASMGGFAIRGMRQTEVDSVLQFAGELANQRS